MNLYLEELAHLQEDVFGVVVFHFTVDSCLKYDFFLHVNYETKPFYHDQVRWSKLV